MIDMYYEPSRTSTDEICPACNGLKIQTNKEGLRVLCPVCGGTGKYRQYNMPYYESITITTTNDKVKYQMWQ